MQTTRQSQNIVAALEDWDEHGVDYAVATLVATDRSTPQPAGVGLAVNAAGQVLGSVSGGCVESSLVALCLDTLESRTPVLVTFGLLDGSDPFAIGLTCGGTIDVLIEPVTNDRIDLHRKMRSLTSCERSFAVVTELAETSPLPSADAVARPVATTHHLVLRGRGADLDGTGSAPHLSRTAFADVARHIESTGIVALPGDATRRAAITVHDTAPTMFVCGAVDFAAALVQIGVLLGYRVVVCDARPTFATVERFPLAHQVVVDWPHRYLQGIEITPSSMLCVLTHDERFDIPLLAWALEQPFTYIGAMGSRSTCARRLDQLRQKGVAEAALRRLHAPIGLDLGGRTAAEAAVSIAAEIIAEREGRDGRSLSATTGSIHAGIPSTNSG